MDTMEALALAKEIAGGWKWENELVEPEENRLDIHLKNADDLVPAVAEMLAHRLGYLAAITGIDLGPEAGELEALYHFCHVAAVVTLRIRLPRVNPTVATLTGIIPGAEPFERELSEMFGVTVVGLRAPDHLYLPEDWPDEVYPQRKDFDPAVLDGEAQRSE